MLHRTKFVNTRKSTPNINFQETEMNKKVTDFAADWQANWTQSMEKLTALNVDNTQKCLDLQMGMFKAYSEAAVAQFNALAGAKEVKDVMEVVKQQAVDMQAINEKGAADLAELAKVNAAYGQELQALMQEMTEKAMPKAA